MGDEDAKKSRMKKPSEVKESIKHRLSAINKALQQPIHGKHTDTAGKTSDPTPAAGAASKDNSAKSGAPKPKGQAPVQRSEERKSVMKMPEKKKEPCSRDDRKMNPSTAEEPSTNGPKKSPMAKPSRSNGLTKETARRNKKKRKLMARYSNELGGLYREDPHLDQLANSTSTEREAARAMEKSYRDVYARVKAQTRLVMEEFEQLKTLRTQTRSGLCERIKQQMRDQILLEGELDAMLSLAEGLVSQNTNTERSEREPEAPAGWFGWISSLKQKIW